MVREIRLDLNDELALYNVSVLFMSVLVYRVVEVIGRKLEKNDNAAISSFKGNSTFRFMGSPLLVTAWN